MSERKSLIPEFGPFAGMRVIASGSLIAMPFAASMLAAFGAEVIQIERPGVGDTMRGLAPIVKEGDSQISAGCVLKNCSRRDKGSAGSSSSCTIIPV